jgi:hypothetical protein
MYPDEWRESLDSSTLGDVLSRIREFLDSHPEAKEPTARFRTLTLLHDTLGLNPRQMNAVSGWIEGGITDDVLREILGET